MGSMPYLASVRIKCSTTDNVARNQKMPRKMGAITRNRKISVSIERTTPKDPGTSVPSVIQKHPLLLLNKFSPLLTPKMARTRKSKKMADAPSDFWEEADEEETPLTMSGGSSGRMNANLKKIETDLKKIAPLFFTNSHGEVDPYVKELQN